MNIVLQLLFPIAISYTPAVIATIPTEKIATTSYIISQGETTESIAKRHQLSIKQLKDLNQSRIFQVPFDSLGAGDEIDIPKTQTLSWAQVENDKATAMEMKLANSGVFSGDLLYKQDPARYAGQKVKSAIVNEANKSVQEWLNQFGTARIQLDVNDDFNLDNSALDFLVPLYDKEQFLLFTQLGARNKDSRNTVNVGIGIRTNIGKWMYGINTFFDNDITGHNQRIGVGSEAWTDYLKLSANSYFGITNWHQSREFENYNERPADGYDIRAEAYLPAYPQLGGKLMYEKYRGDEVALFGKENRQKNPYAVTAGINYTPIPLVTLGIDHRVGQSSNNDTSFNLQFNYRLGESWQKQINSSAVAATRLLTGSRYDLVERNNTIVLDYQKQELIRLSLPAQLIGIEGDTVILTAQVVAKYGTDRIDWDAGSLIAAGGNISLLSPHVIRVTYPPYQTTSGINNTYILNAVAHDTRGNISNQATTHIQVNPQNLSNVNSTLIASPVNIEANGSDTSAVTLTLKDSNNNPVAGQNVVLATTLGTINAATESSHGIYTATLTAGNVSGIATVTANVNGNALNVTPATVFLSAGVTDIGRSTLVAAPINIEANGSDTSTVTLSLKDSNDNPVAGQNIVFASTLGTVNTAVESSSGIYTATLTAGTVSGVASVTANVNSSALSIAPATVTLSAGPLDAMNSLLTVNTNSINADDRTGALITFIARDANSNPIPDLDISFTTDLTNSQITNSSHSGNNYVANIDGTKVGVANIAVRLSGTPIAGLTETVTITPGAWNQAQVPVILALHQAVQECIPQTQPSGGFSRVVMFVEALTLYDNYDNETTGVIMFNLHSSTVTTVDNTQISITARSNLTLSNNSSGPVSVLGDSFTTEGLCTVNGIVQTNSSITATQVTDSFGSTSINRVFTIGSGS
ncbi:inverse autotransporter beta domain-containing protein [Yersinia mollaretii]|uniref:inverse autotransporter beta domain-containing protein n=1 Tax=Yersinia mollaretii TaxID=33060 RepID=UPI001643CB7B|nr:inverse autotransporter beta domain-containing protein [Yersinia mollaretii]